MKSPFPGMDPYLEKHWLDVHTRLVMYAADHLNSDLPQDLVAVVEERIAVESDNERLRAFGPDVRVFEPPVDETSAVEPEGGQVTAKYRLVAVVDPITERFIRIIESDTERLVTVIEFVNPTNKRAPGLTEFRAKRAQLLASGVNFVEIDLVRAGNWRKLLRPHICSEAKTTQYRMTFRVPHDPCTVHLEPMPIRDRLPKINIPLRSNDPVVSLDLQTLFDDAYSRGRYQKRINYARETDPPLEAADAAWADALLKSAGKRK